MCQTKSGIKNKGSCQCHNLKRMSLIGDTQRVGALRRWAFRIPSARTKAKYFYYC